MEFNPQQKPKQWPIHVGNLCLQNAEEPASAVVTMTAATTVTTLRRRIRLRQVNTTAAATQVAVVWIRATTAAAAAVTPALRAPVVVKTKKTTCAAAHHHPKRQLPAPSRSCPNPFCGHNQTNAVIKHVIPPTPTSNHPFKFKPFPCGPRKRPRTITKRIATMTTMEITTRVATTTMTAIITKMVVITTMTDIFMNMPQRRGRNARVSTHLCPSKRRLPKRRANQRKRHPHQRKDP